MSYSTNNRGVAPLIVVGAIALLGAIGLWTIKPKKLDGDSRRASQSVQASAHVEQATTVLIETQNKGPSEAASSLQVMTEAINDLQDSLSKTFLQQESAVALSKLPPCDPLSLLASERRKNAVLAGQLQLARSLYEKELRHSSDLANDKANAEAKYRAAQSEREQVDRSLVRIAAEKLGAERTKRTLFVAVICLSLVALWWKFTHLSPFQYSRVVQDVEAGKHGIEALDAATTHLQQWLCRLWKKF